MKTKNIKFITIFLVLLFCLVGAVNAAEDTSIDTVATTTVDDATPTDNTIHEDIKKVSTEPTTKVVSDTSKETKKDTDTYFNNTDTKDNVVGVIEKNTESKTKAKLGASANNNKLSEDKIAPTCDINATGANYGLSAFVEVDLHDATGNVNFIVNGNTYTGVLNNGKFIQEFTKYTLGKNTGKFRYEGDDTYNSLEKDFSFDIIENIKVAETIYKPQPAIIEVILGNATGKVNITLGNNHYTSDIINGVATTEIESKNYTDGTNTITIKYLGDDKFAPFTTTKTFKVLDKENSTIFASVYKTTDKNLIIIAIPHGENGTVNVTVNGEKKVLELINGIAKTENTWGDITELNTVYGGSYKLNPSNSSSFANLVNNVVNNENYLYYFNQIDGGRLFDFIEDGTTLDFQGSIINPDTNNIVQIAITKPVNIISSTKDAYIDLNTTAGSLLGESPGNSFAVLRGGSGSNITGIYLHNTQLWVSNTNNVVFDNISVVVEDQRVGSGVGATSIRDNSTYVTLKNSYFYTRNNGGSTTFTFSWAEHCIINNSTIKAEGNVGNLVYLNIFNVAGAPSGVPLNKYNIVSNNKIYGKEGSAISVGLMVEGAYNIIANNTCYKCSISTSFGGQKPNNNTYYGNTMTDGSGLTAQPYSIIYNNTATGTLSTGANSIAYNNTVGKTMTIGANTKAYNNTLNDVTISSAGVLFEDNNVSGKVTISQPINLKNNKLNEVLLNTNAKNSNITNNNITGTIESKAANVNIDSNNITTTNDYTVIVTGANNKITNNILFTSTKAGNDTINAKADTIIEGNTEAGSKFNITEETYSDFFDSNGVLINPNVKNYSELTFKGTFNDKVFKFDNIIVSITGDKAVINNGFISTDNDAIINLEDITINNTKEGIENSILLNTKGNLVRNVKIYRTSITGTSREIMVNGDNNQILSNTFDLTIPVMDIDWTQNPLALSNTNAITAIGSFNTINSNKITVKNSTTGSGTGFGTINVIDITGNDNTVNSNTIVGNSADLIYGINFGTDSNRNTINSNKITLNSAYYTAGIQIGSLNYNNTINSNTVNLTSSISYGIIATPWAGEVTGTIIESNKIYITANQLWGIELCGSSPDFIKDTTINKNDITVNGNYSIGIAVSGNNINIATNTLTVNGTTNSTDDSSSDKIKPTTAGLIIQDSNNVVSSNNKMTVIKGANIILRNTEHSKITATSTTNYPITAKNNTNIILINSNNNIIESQKAETNGAYAIELISSSNNNITNNYLNANNIKGGDAAVHIDSSSVNNNLNKNTPNLNVLTDDNYLELFNENGTYKYHSDILSINSDIHNKILIFDNMTSTMTIKNVANYTLYNTTIIIAGKSSTRISLNIENLNFENVNKPVYKDEIKGTYQRDVYFKNSNIKVTGDNIVAFDAYNKDSYIYLDISDSNITMDGENVVVVNYAGYNQGQPFYMNRNNINVTATENATVLNADYATIKLDSNKIIMNAKNAVTANLNNSKISYSNFINNQINITADKAVALNMIKTDTGSSTISGNIININSSNPTTAINITGTGSSVTIQNNQIFTNSINGETPVIYVGTKSSSVKSNKIIANDTYGDNAVAGTGVTISGNTPKTAHINIEEYEPWTLKENTLSFSITNDNNQNITGNIKVTINGEETIVTNNNIKYKPTTLNDVNITITYSDPKKIYGTTTLTTTIKLDKDAIIQDQNNTINTQTETINDLNQTIQTQNNTINTQTETIKNQNSIINDLNNIIQTQREQINEANNKAAIAEQKATEATVTIKTVKAAKTVKKSKKFTIKITLKKAVKGKKVFLIFNGKTYTKKTNKKGIAKITIKKSIIKKLSGKKVKYQVIYGEKIVKRSVKIKK